ncbi:MAG: 5-(carboxyamino)imidazole ribonucleotide mutase [Elusimicrobiota bacterium]|jgi:5-(carboxyamino)imidazole ribonucleotide mutase|nr:5-(carboxyamino)imidazole ribonucleotide mutase [Elusimicrobiota bacterium]
MKKNKKIVTKKSLFQNKEKVKITKNSPLVGIVIGSDSDLKIMQNTAKKLDELGINYEITISSAHRTLEKTLDFVRSSEKRGIELFIVGAGMAAHLAGIIAGQTILPVIGIPMSGGDLNGIDALYSTVQMPSGIPVATLTIGNVGATNAAILATQILSLKYPELKVKLKNLKEDMKKQVFEKDIKLQKIGYKKYLEKI